MKVCLVASEGGHLTELLYLKSAYQDYDYFFISYLYPRVKNLKFRKYMVPLFTKNIFNIIPSFWIILKALLKEKPKVIVSTGSEVAIPVFILAKLLRIKTVFIETIVAFDKPSLTGRILYHLSNKFFVQNPETLSAYGNNAEYKGGII